MGILTKDRIIEYLESGKLLKNAFKDKNDKFDVEPASYDLRAGMIIWKETNLSSGASKVCSQEYNPKVETWHQKVDIQPGQVMFVITREEVMMPTDLCGTVYAKNKFSRDGILALTTGHIDPGIQCPIVIRLINLRSIPCSFYLGTPIYTIVFHTLEFKETDVLVMHPQITMEQTIERTIESAHSALGNALNDLSLTNGFIKKDDVGLLITKYILKRGWAWMVVLLAAGAAIIKIIEYLTK